MSHDSAIFLAMFIVVALVGGLSLFLYYIVAKQEREIDEDGDRDSK